MKYRKYGSMHVGVNTKTAFATKGPDPMSLPWREQIGNFLADVEALRIAHKIEYVKIKANTARISRGPKPQAIMPGIEKELCRPPVTECLIDETKLTFKPIRLYE